MAVVANNNYRNRTSIMIFPKKLLLTLLTATLLPCVAKADLIIDEFTGPAAPSTIGGYAMTSFGMPALPGFPGTVTSVASPTSTGGDVLFEEQGGGTAMHMTVGSPNWWQFPDHGNVYTTDIHWVELVMPPNTRAFSFFVGAEFNGRGWIEATDGTTTARLDPFYVRPGTTPGFGVYTTDACASIERIIVEPNDWGMGRFAINQGDACTTTVPEPAPIALFGLGLLALVGSRKFFQPAPDAV